MQVETDFPAPWHIEGRGDTTVIVADNNAVVLEVKWDDIVSTDEEGGINTRLSYICDVINEAWSRTCN